jgi:hypothetical protein
MPSFSGASVSGGESLGHHPPTHMYESHAIWESDGFVANVYVEARRVSCCRVPSAGLGGSSSR